jgi:hypothetical protein
MPALGKPKLTAIHSFVESVETRCSRRTRGHVQAFGSRSFMVCRLKRAIVTTCAGAGSIATSAEISIEGFYESI